MNTFKGAITYKPTYITSNPNKNKTNTIYVKKVYQ